MKAIEKLRRLLGCCKEDDTPEIVEDLYSTHLSHTELRDIFHTELEMIADCQGITYYEAFVKHINSVNLEIHDRKEVEEYLWQKGLHNVDIQTILDAFYEADATKND
jgi:hypothetical protein